MRANFGNEMTPLAFKLGYIENNKLYFVTEGTGALLPALGRRTYKMARHGEHIVPADDCTCGIKSTINPDWLMDATFFPQKADNGLFIVIGVQILGTFRIDEDYNIRSEMVFPFRVYYPVDENFDPQGIRRWIRLNGIPHMNYEGVDQDGWTYQSSINERWKRYYVSVKCEGWAEWLKAKMSNG